MAYNIRITYFGNIKSITSWSKVAREILLSLIKKGIKISIMPTRGFLYSRDFDIGILEKYISEEPGDIIFSFEHPSKYQIFPRNVKKIGFIVYEFTSLPDSWVSNINRYLDLAVVPSKFTYDVFLKSGVNPDKLKILRYGYNPLYYYPSERNKNIRNFLTIASPHRREALDIALECFYSAFKNVKDVKLTVKLSYMPFKKSKSFEIPDFRETLKRYSSRLSDRLSIITEPLSEKHISRLYRESDIYFSLSKAESFGLPFLESIASNRPVISLKYSGQTDFLSEKNAVFINHTLKPADEDTYEKTSQTQYAAYPDISDCISKLKKIYEEGFKNDVYLPSGYSWDDVTQDFIKIIDELLSR